MGSWWSDHPDLEGIARRGRSDLSEETVAAERDAELLRKRRRSLADLCFEWMSRGDLVTVGIADNQFEGRITTAINDLLVMTTKTLEVAINVSLVEFARSDRAAVFDGTTGDRKVSSFRAELGRCEIAGSSVRLIGVRGSFDLTAAIEASTDDHVLVRDRQGLEWALPRTAIACAVGVATERPG